MRCDWLKCVSDRSWAHSGYSQRVLFSYKNWKTYIWKIKLRQLCLTVVKSILRSSSTPLTPLCVSEQNQFCEKPQEKRWTITVGYWTSFRLYGLEALQFLQLSCLRKACTIGLLAELNKNNRLCRFTTSLGICSDNNRKGGSLNTKSKTVKK